MPEIDNQKQQELRDAGLKVTVPRIKILTLLNNPKHPHMSAEEVYSALLEQGEDVGLATVYRVLTQFEQAGLVRRQHFEGGYSVFELDQGEHHDHLVCMTCGRVVEFVDDVIEARQKDIAQQHGFALTDHQLTLYGQCQQCR